MNNFGSYTSFEVMHNYKVVRNTEKKYILIKDTTCKNDENRNCNQSNNTAEYKLYNIQKIYSLLTTEYKKKVP